MKSLALALLLAVGCATPQPAPLAGEWGGTHVGLSLGATGGTLDYDCATGTIGPLSVGAGGRFTAEGTHTPGTGGPERVGQVLPNLRATYSGAVRGDRMTLQGRLETGVLLGPFELRRGAEPILLRCL